MPRNRGVLWELFEECLDVMVRAAKVSEALSADHYPTVNRVTPLLLNLQSTCKNKLVQYLTEVAESFVKMLICCSTNDFQSVEEWWRPMYLEICLILFIVVLV